MSDTTFIAGTVIAADWLNDVNDATYTKLTNVGTISVAAATVLDDASVGAMLTTMGGAPLASPTFTGTPTLPTGTIAVTQAAADSSTKIATTAFVQQEVPAASTTAAGKVELATTAETQTGSDGTRTITPAGLKEALLYSKTFSSSDQTVAFGSKVTVAHGLGAVPVFVQTFLKCATAEYNYSVGDIIPYGNMDVIGVGMTTVSADSTNVVVVNSGTNSIRINDKNTPYSINSITPGNWRWVIRAMA